MTPRERAALQRVLGQRMLAGKKTTLSDIVREGLQKLPDYRDALEALA
jgi:hypothetical protein